MPCCGQVQATENELQHLAAYRNTAPRGNQEALRRFFWAPLLRLAMPLPPSTSAKASLASPAPCMGGDAKALAAMASAEAAASGDAAGDAPSLLEEAFMGVVGGSGAGNAGGEELALGPGVHACAAPGPISVSMTSGAGSSTFERSKMALDVWQSESLLQ